MAVGTPWRLASNALFVLALFVLAFRPALWLAGSWFEPGYGSDGEWVFLAVLGIVLFALSSKPCAPAGDRDRDVALVLCFSTALVRLLGVILAIHALGALALVADVYAIARVVGLHRRARAVSPGGLAALFAFTLPVERLVQRGLGYPLQRISIALVSPLLRVIEPEIAIEGVAIRAPGAALSIDLPCSGARGLVLLLTLALALVALRRVAGARRIALHLALTVGLALAANTVRIALLVAGVFHPPFGIDVMVEPWHSIVGLAPLGLAALGLLSPRLVTCPHGPIAFADADRSRHRARPLAVIAGPVLLVIALAVVRAPEHPIDVGKATAPLALPMHLDGFIGEPLELSERERAYFTAFGGQASKVHYADPWHAGADRIVIAVRTSAPLRHLHPADECLIGRGHAVKHLGVIHGSRAPSTVYESTSPNGDKARVEVTYVSYGGEVAASVAEVAWSWMKAPGTTWTMIERVSSPATCTRDPASCNRFFESIERALMKENRT